MLTHIAQDATTRLYAVKATTHGYLEIQDLPDDDESAKVSANDTTAGYLNGKLVAGAGITLTEGSDGGNETLTIASTITDTDIKAKISTNDTTAGFLNGKLVAGTGITLTEGSDGGDETLTIASTIVDTDIDIKAKVSANDTTAGYFNGKLIAGIGVTLTENNDAGDETLSIIANSARNTITAEMAVGVINNTYSTVAPFWSTINTVDTSNNQGAAQPRAGSITGITFSADSIVVDGATNDLLKCDVYKNGAAIGLGLTMTVATPSSGYAVQAIGTDTIAAGDKLTVGIYYFDGGGATRNFTLTKCIFEIEVYYN